MAAIDLTANLQSQSSMQGDALYRSVVLLMHFDGLNNATSFADNSPTPRTWTTAGAAKLSSAQKKFGATSLSLDGAASWVETAGTADFALGAGDFAIEFWINTTDTNFVPVDFYTTSQNTWQLWASATGTLQFYAGNTGGNGAVVTTTSAINNGAWRHIRVSRSGTTTSIAVDGTVEATATDTRNYSYVTTKLAIGAQVSTRNASYDLSGYLADLRITKGAARSGVPTAQYPDYGQPQLTTSIRAGANLPGVASVSGGLTTEIRHTAALAGSVTLAGALGNAVVLGAPLANSASVAGSLSTSIRAAAALSAQGSLAGSLGTSIRPSATLSSSSALSAALSVNVGTSASLLSNSSLVGALTTSVQLASAIGASSALGAALSTSVRLGAALSAAPMLGGVLTVGQGSMRAAFSASTSMAGELLVPVFSGGPYMLVEAESMTVAVPADATHMLVL